MRRIKSAPANIANMIHRKKKQQQEISKLNINNYEITIIKNNKENIEKENIKYKNNIINYKNKKKITPTICGIISDSFYEINSNIHIIDTNKLSYIIEFINNFISNKFNKKNLENLILSLMIRFIVSQVYHDLIIKIKENLHLIK